MPPPTDHDRAAFRDAMRRAGWVRREQRALPGHDARVTWQHEETGRVWREDTAWRVWEQMGCAPWPF